MKSSSKTVWATLTDLNRIEESQFFKNLSFFPLCGSENILGSQNNYPPLQLDKNIRLIRVLDNRVTQINSNWSSWL